MFRFFFGVAGTFGTGAVAMVLATILQKFRVELVPDQMIVPDATFTLRPMYGLKVILHSRSKSLDR